jgi:hypothetical protein
MHCMRFFTPAFLVSSLPVTEDDIKVVCEFYNVDTSVIVKELTDFRGMYKQLQTHVTMDDLTQVVLSNDGNEGPTRPCDDDMESAVANDEEGVRERESSKTCWIDHGFIKPLRLLEQLSGFTTLHYIYKILVTLPVTSCSAERIMSRVRIVKNWLRSTMLDDWFSSLLCLASEKDILSTLDLNDIIDRFADCSDVMRRNLIYS